MCFFLIIIFFVWKICLFEKYGAYLPIDKNIDTQQLSCIMSPTSSLTGTLRWTLCPWVAKGDFSTSYVA